MNPLKTHFSYPKFADDSYRILLLYNNYFLQPETAEALSYLGHNVRLFPLGQDAKQLLSDLLKTCVEFRPDAIMTMNHFGFDHEGEIARVLAQLNIPVIVWYLDDFRFIIPDARPLAQPNVLLATIEQQDLKPLRAYGFQHVLYLPTASALNPGNAYLNKEYDFLKNAISFVGNSFKTTKQKWCRPGYDDFIKALPISEWLKTRRPYFLDFCRQKQNHYFKRDQDFNHYVGYAAAETTRRYRLLALQSLNDQFLHVFGDDHWREMCLQAAFHPPVHNIRVAPFIFAGSAININLTSCQLRTAVNLRVFDVPAAGGFLLTDWQEGLTDLFDVEEEMAVFHSTEELKDKTRYYLKHPQARERIIRKARLRVQKDHLLYMRLDQLLRQAKKIFA